MKKAFEQNVSRAKPRLRLGAFTGVVDPAEPEETSSPEASAAEPEMARAAEAPAAASDLSAEVRARIERARAPRPSAAEAIDAALHPRAGAPAGAAASAPAMAAEPTGDAAGAHRDAARATRWRCRRPHRAAR